MSTLNPDILATGVFTVAAGLVSGLFTWLASRNSERQASLLDENRVLRAGYIRALEQVEAFHAVEGLFADEWAAMGAQPNANFARAEFRTRVEAQGFARPKMTGHDARGEIDSLRAKAR